MEMMTVQTEVVEEQEAANHAVAFSAVRTRIETCHGASTGNDAVVLNSNYPASRALEMVGGAVANESGRGG